MRLLNSTTYGDTFGKPNPFKQRSVFRFPWSGGDGQSTVSAGGYASPSLPSLAPSDFATGIANLSMPTFHATDTWKPAENNYQSIIDSMIAAQSQSGSASYGASQPISRGGSWGRGTGSGLGLSAYGFKGTTGLPEHRGTGKLGLQQEFSDALDSMFAEMKRQGLGTPTITDGFRSYQGQVAAKQKWAAKGKPNMAATPGRSIHGLGLAADLGLTNAQYKWMKQNAYRFGIVNLPSESWHWQYDAARWNQR